jgi:hypothetical protein
MRFLRKGLIKESEAMILLDAIKEKGELVFPLNPDEITAVKKTIRTAQTKQGAYIPSTWEKIKAKWNYSYASVTSFALWLGVTHIEIENTTSKGGRSAIKLRLRSNHQIEWDALKASAFRAPLI